MTLNKHSWEATHVLTFPYFLPSHFGGVYFYFMSFGLSFYCFCLISFARRVIVLHFSGQNLICLCWLFVQILLSKLSMPSWFSYFWTLGGCAGWLKPAHPFGMEHTRLVCWLYTASTALLVGCAACCVDRMSPTHPRIGQVVGGWPLVQNPFLKALSWSYSSHDPFPLRDSSHASHFLDFTKLSSPFQNLSSSLNSWSADLQLHLLGFYWFFSISLHHCRVSSIFWFLFTSWFEWVLSQSFVLESWYWIGGDCFIVFCAWYCCGSIGCMIHVLVCKLLGPLVCLGCLHFFVTLFSWMMLSIML